MSEIVSQDELKERVLVALYRYSQSGERSLTAQNLGSLIDGSFGIQRIELALSALDREDLVRGSYFANAPAEYRISEDGYYEVEKTILARLDDAEANADPLQSIEERLIPASDRMVDFGDNQKSQTQAVTAVDDATEAIRSSNTLSEDLRNEALSNLLSWQELVAKGRPFAIGAFRFLVWDRVKSVIEGGIEDAYRIALTAVLITLGSIILGLL